MYRYYDAYLSYFSEYLRDHTPNESFERFIFSSAYNFDPDLAANDVKDIKRVADEGKRHPEMLNRFLAIIVHPFIHLAYGLEFGIPAKSQKVCQISSINIYDLIIQDARSCNHRRPQGGSD